MYRYCIYLYKSQRTNPNARVSTCLKLTWTNMSGECKMNLFSSLSSLHFERFFPLLTYLSCHIMLLQNYTLYILLVHSFLREMEDGKNVLNMLLGKMETYHITQTYPCIQNRNRKSWGWLHSHSQTNYYMSLQSR